MISAGDIYAYIDGFAPFSSAMAFDNPGLLAGEFSAPVETALLSLDITPAVVREAAEAGAQLIVSHHPVIFHPLRKLEPGSAPYLLAQNGIAAVCAHTNLDLAEGGVNTCLAAHLRLGDVSPLKRDEASGLPAALQGETDRAYSPRDFAAFVKEALGCDGLRYTDGRREITRVGLCGGGGADFLPDAVLAGCQAFVTGESKHSVLLDAENRGITYVDAGHFYTENVVIRPLLERLAERFPSVRFLESARMHSPARYL